jgi:hypothetical protein
MFVGACDIEEARRDPGFLEFGMELARQGRNDTWLRGQRRHQGAIARSVRVGG